MLQLRTPLFQVFPIIRAKESSFTLRPLSPSARVPVRRIRGDLIGQFKGRTEPKRNIARRFRRRPSRLASERLLVCTLLTGWADRTGVALPILHVCLAVMNRAGLAEHEFPDQDRYYQSTGGVVDLLWRALTPD